MKTNYSRSTKHFKTSCVEKNNKLKTLNKQKNLSFLQNLLRIQLKTVISVRTYINKLNPLKTFLKKRVIRRQLKKRSELLKLDCVLFVNKIKKNLEKYVFYFLLMKIKMRLLMIMKFICKWWKTLINEWNLYQTVSNRTTSFCLQQNYKRFWTK